MWDQGEREREREREGEFFLCTRTYLIEPSLHYTFVLLFTTPIYPIGKA